MADLKRPATMISVRKHEEIVEGLKSEMTALEAERARQSELDAQIAKLRAELGATRAANEENARLASLRKREADELREKYEGVDGEEYPKAFFVPDHWDSWETSMVVANDADHEGVLRQSYDTLFEDGESAAQHFAKDNPRPKPQQRYVPVHAEA